MKLSRHANDRKRQRGFSNFTLEIIMKFGNYKIVPGRATKVFFGKKEHQKTVQELKKAIQLLDKAKGGNIIIKDNCIVTVFINDAKKEWRKTFLKSQDDWEKSIESDIKVIEYDHFDGSGTEIFVVKYH